MKLILYHLWLWKKQAIDNDFNVNIHGENVENIDRKLETLMQT